jgi:glucose-6-phosphate isomerase
MMALLGIWYRNFMQASTCAVLPYDQYLALFPAWLQQTDMESNGKQTDRNGQKVTYKTGPVIWGQPGTNGQHAFYQLIHQGTELIPCDFIASVHANHPLDHHQRLLLCNYIAQPEALMKGKSYQEVMDELLQKGMAEDEARQLAPHRVFEGNKPSNSFLINRLDPFNLGALIACYEHKIFVQGIIWNVFSFDQWGVELGKVLAGKVEKELSEGQPVSSHDSSTNALMNEILKA